MKEALIALAAKLQPYAKIAIAGGPLTGKSLVADNITDHTSIKTDDFLKFPWAEQPYKIIESCNQHDRFVLSGVQVGRVLRKGLDVDIAVWLDTPLQRLYPGQEIMRKGCYTIFNQWAWLHRNKVIYA